MLFGFSKSKSLVFLLGIFICCKANGQSNGLVVKTDKGCVRGLAENGIFVFKGVPYAAPPVKALRFMPPVEHQPWDDTLAATKFGHIAVQNRGEKVVGSEDCLSLNIYTPKPDNHKRAVLVWVHGGSMISGSGSGRDGHAFADRDNIVTVTINYRLGVFGFLYLGDIDKRFAASGNNGVLDCIMALKWIKQNIASFGGDPDRVTIMGESAGAKLISAVAVSPKSKGLFNRYIAESGSAQCIRDTATAKSMRTRILGQLHQQDVQKLMAIPADSLMKMQGAVCQGSAAVSYLGPVYDGVVIRYDAYQYAGSKSLSHIKALIGTNKYEAAAFISKDLKDPAMAIKPMFGADAPMVYASYLRELKTQSPYDAAIKVFTQYMYQMHSYRFAKALSQNHIPVWMYRFEYDNGKRYGATHGQELQYVWDDHHINTTAADTITKQLTINLHQAWVAFIKTGNPNITSLPVWPNYKNNTRQVMVFDRTNKTETLTSVFDDKNFPSSVFVLK